METVHVDRGGEVMTGVFCTVTFVCGTIVGAVVGIVLYEDRGRR